MGEGKDDDDRPTIEILADDDGAETASGRPTPIVPDPLSFFSQATVRPPPPSVMLARWDEIVMDAMKGYTADQVVAKYALSAVDIPLACEIVTAGGRFDRAELDRIKARLDDGRK